MTDPIADMLTRLRNANTAMHDTVKMPSSKLKESLAVVLEREGYIAGFEVKPSDKGPGDELEITLKYDADRNRTIARPAAGLQARAADLRPGRPDAARPRRARRRGPVDEQRPHDRPRGAQAPRRWGGALLCLVSGAAGQRMPGGALMSRIGRSPIAVPVRRRPSQSTRAPVTVKGPEGSSARPLPGPASPSARRTRTLLVERPDDQRHHRALHGLTRSLVANMVTGVTDGFTKELEIVGVGYRAVAQGPGTLELALGFSPPGRRERPRRCQLRGARARPGSS